MIDAAKAVAIPMDREVLHVLPQQYVVDDQDGIRDPLGMAGVRLEAKVHIVTTAVASAQNVIKCANRCNLQVADIVLESLASSQAVLEEDEKELGVALVDIGGGTCDLMVYADGAIVHTSVLPLGGGHVTNDIATVLRTPLDSAEKIKRKYGCAWRGHVEDGETMEVPSVGGRGPRVLPRIKLVEVIEPRVEEIFEHVKKELMRCGYFDGLAAGIVLTGGATAMDGVCDIAEQVLGLPTRRGDADEDRRPRRCRALAGVLDRRRPRDVRRRPRQRRQDAPARCRRSRRACSSAPGAGSPRCSSEARPSSDRAGARAGSLRRSVSARGRRRDERGIEQLGRRVVNVGGGQRAERVDCRIGPVRGSLASTASSSRRARPDTPTSEASAVATAWRRARSSSPPVGAIVARFASSAAIVAATCGPASGSISAAISSDGPRPS